MRTSLYAVLLLAVHWTSARERSKRQAVNVQNPPVWQALDQLRGSAAPSAADIQRIMASAVPGQSYPVLSYIPQTSFSCSNVRQPGFYADPETRCQVFRRCELNNYMFSYICPNTTIFNQITLVCDYWYNVNCPNSQSFVDYSNPRIYIQNARLLDDSNYGGGGAGGEGGGQGGNYAGGQAVSGGGRGEGGGLASGAGLYNRPASGQYTSAGSGQYTSGGSGQYTSGGSGQYTSGGGAPAPYAPSGGTQQYQSGGSAPYASAPTPSYQNPAPSAYTGSFSGSLTQTPGQTLPYGTAPLQQTTYPSAIQYSQYNVPSQTYSQPPAAYPQQPLYSAAPAQGIQQPAYRSLTNRLLRLQADASDRIHDVMATPGAPASTPMAAEG